MPGDQPGRREDDSFMRKIIRILITVILGQLIAFLVMVGVYANQINNNTEKLKGLSVERIAEAVSERLTGNYMTADKVNATIDKARSDLRQDQINLVTPIKEKLDEMQGDITYLVKREIEKGDKHR